MRNIRDRAPKTCEVPSYNSPAVEGIAAVVALALARRPAPASLGGRLVRLLHQLLHQLLQRLLHRPVRLARAGDARRRHPRLDQRARRGNRLPATPTGASGTERGSRAPREGAGARGDLSSAGPASSREGVQWRAARRKGRRGSRAPAAQRRSSVVVRTTARASPSPSAGRAAARPTERPQPQWSWRRTRNCGPSRAHGPQTPRVSCCDASWIGQRVAMSDQRPPSPCARRAPLCTQPSCRGNHPHTDGAFQLRHARSWNGARQRRPSRRLKRRSACVRVLRVRHSSTQGTATCRRRRPPSSSARGALLRVWRRLRTL